MVLVDFAGTFFNKAMSLNTLNILCWLSITKKIIRQIRTIKIEAPKE
jgi:hypothetical protein